MENDGFQTPGRQTENKEQAGTAGGTQSRFQGMVQSKYELNQGHEDSESQNRAEELDKLEKEIKQCGRRLKEVFDELQKESDKTSDHALELQQERAALKKRVIDLDYQHKVLSAHNLKQSRRKEEEEKQRYLREAEEERQRRRQEVEEKLQKQKEQRQKRIQEINQRIQRQRQQREKLAQQQREAGQQKTEQKVQASQGGEQEKLDESRRRLRIAQIESQLAESRLRRSRISALNAQLDYLRSSYLYPYYPSYYSWRDYYRPYPYHYSPYIYSPSYFYPYRWWL